jgi:hypothetical protein
MNESAKRISALADGVRSSKQIAELVGLNERYVRRLMARHDIPTLTRGGQPGASNHQFESGRRIDLAGYVIVTAPAGWASAKKRSGRAGLLIYEHRLVAEQTLGRHLRPEERIDHIDGLTLHNAPDNLRVFSSNAEHLRATLTGQVPHWSAAGYENMKLRHRPDAVLQQVDTYRQRRAAGAVRLRQILLAALQLGTDSPFLLGSSHHTKKAVIDMSSRSTIERALADLCQRWGWPQTP